MNFISRLRAMGREYLPPPLKPPLRRLAIGARQRYRDTRYLTRRLNARTRDPVFYRHVRQVLQHPELPPQLRDLLLRLLIDRPIATRAGRTKHPSEALNPTILYVTNRLSPDALKDILALGQARRPGCAVLSSFELENADPILDAGIPLLTYSNPLQLVRILHQIRAPVTLARRGSSLEAALVRLFGPGRFVYRPYDFVDRNPVGPVEAECRKVTFQGQAERFLLRTADGLVHIHGDLAMRSVRRQYNFAGPDVRVQPGCLDALAVQGNPESESRRDGRVHLVEARIFGRGPSDARPGLPAPPASEIEGFLRQGIHFHVYYANHGEPPREIHLRQHLDLAERFSNYHLHPAPPYRTLVQELSRYDAAYSYHPKRREHQLDRSFGPLLTSFYAYLDAGLPVLTAPDNWPMADLVRSHQIGLVLQPGDVQRAGEILKAADLKQLRQNVRQARPRLHHDSQLLLRFLETLAGTTGEGSEVRLTPNPLPESQPVAPLAMNLIS